MLINTPRREAYFCAEFGFHESFPIYSGGLGILAGDHCKAASDMSLPFVAVGLLYQQGYFIQTIDAQGQQVARYKSHSSDELPITPVEQDGEPLIVSVPFPGREIFARVWQAKVGHIRLHLLDANTPENAEQDRQHERNGTGYSVTKRMTEQLTSMEKDVMVVGFARRFATYKRATLIFSDLPRLEALLTNPDRPVVLVFAGKAHPQDNPGQQLIKVIHDLSMQPSLMGHILLLEVELTVEMDLNGLAPEDVRVECVVAIECAGSHQESGPEQFFLQPVAGHKGDATLFSARVQPPYPGLQTLRIRAYPYHGALTHPLEMGAMLWV